jgi:hypothetical protein
MVKSGAARMGITDEAWLNDALTHYEDGTLLFAL